MAIKLQVEDYCQNCPEFEADVRKERAFYNDLNVITETTVACEHCDKCREIHKSIERNTKKNDIT